MKRRKGFSLVGGFSLVEVLVAVAIVGLVSSTAYTVMISSLKHDSDNRVRAQAIASADAWLDRFRAKSLDFNHFTSQQTYDYGYDYSADAWLTHAADPNKAQTNAEWGGYKFGVQATPYLTNPAIWRLDVTVYYQKVGGEESYVDISTLVRQ